MNLFVALVPDVYQHMLFPRFSCVTLLMLARTSHGMRALVGRYARGPGEAVIAVHWAYALYADLTPSLLAYHGLAHMQHYYQQAFFSADPCRGLQAFLHVDSGYDDATVQAVVAILNMRGILPAFHLAPGQSSLDKSTTQGDVRRLCYAIASGRRCLLADEDDGAAVLRVPADFATQRYMLVSHIWCLAIRTDNRLVVDTLAARVGMPENNFQLKRTATQTSDAMVDWLGIGSTVYWDRITAIMGHTDKNIFLYMLFSEIPTIKDDLDAQCRRLVRMGVLTCERVRAIWNSSRQRQCQLPFNSSCNWCQWRAAILNVIGVELPHIVTHGNQVASLPC